MSFASFSYHPRPPLVLLFPNSIADHHPLREWCGQEATGRPNVERGSITSFSVTSPRPWSTSYGHKTKPQ